MTRTLPNLIHISRKAMACEFEICLPAVEPSDATDRALEALELVDALEDQLSVFRLSSEISRINLLAAHGPVEVEPRLFDLLGQAMQLYRETQGAYDITAGPLWEAWGFARRAGAIPSPGQLAEAQARVGGQSVQLDPERKTIFFNRPGIKLNLGSIGKGYAVDRCTERLLADGVRDFLLHGGNSSVLAHGCRDVSTPHAPREEERHAERDEYVGGWTVGIRDPLRGGRRLGEIRLQDRALGTSGAQFQSFRHRGKRYGHILDPRTGWPAEGVLSATVLAPTAAWADALSTAFYVLGPAWAEDYCRQHPELAAILICPAAGQPGWTIHSFGLSDNAWA